MQKGWRPANDASDAPPREQRALKSVTFQESVSVINDRQGDMELESQQVVQVSPAGSNLHHIFQNLNGHVSTWWLGPPWLDTGVFPLRLGPSSVWVELPVQGEPKVPRRLLCLLCLRFNSFTVYIDCVFILTSA